MQHPFFFFAFFAWAIGVFSQPLWAAAYHARYRLVTRAGDHQFDVIVVMPENHGLLASLRVAGEPIEDLSQMKAENRALTQNFTEGVLEFAIGVYRQLGLVDSANEGMAREELAPVARGEWPLIAVVPRFEDGPILHMLAFAPGDGSARGTPALKRVYRPGFIGPLAPAPTESIWVDDGLFPRDSVIVSPPYQVNGEPDLWWTVFLSQLPQVNGKLVEAKMYIANPDHDLFLSTAVHGLAKHLGLHRYSGDLIPQRLHRRLAEVLADSPAARATDEFLELGFGTARDTQSRYLREEWRNLFWHMPVQYKMVLGEATERRRIRLYSQVYGLSPREHFIDEDFGNKPTALFQMSLRQFEEEPMKVLSRTPQYGQYLGARLLSATTGLGQSNTCLQLLSSAAKWRIAVEQQIVVPPPQE